MPSPKLGMIALVTLVALLPAHAEAHAGATLRCKSGDLRYPFEPGGPKTFGVFKLRVTGGTCTTAHRVAKSWMNDFEGDILRGHLRLPRSVDGFSFKSLPPDAAQTYRERGRRRATTIDFEYRVPNG
jgi:hypothetical protein